MKLKLTVILLIGVLLTASGQIAAQDFEGGVVKYQQTSRYDFAKTFSAWAGNPRVDNWIASLPSSSQAGQILSFSTEKALFIQDESVNNQLPSELSGALMRASMMTPPKEKLQKVYWDLGKNERVRYVEFMTRNFQVAEPLGSNPWKLTDKKVKVQDCVCTAAELTRGEDKITAWFTPEIPVSIGPAEFCGLPGLILAVDINGETAFIATSVELIKPAAGALTKPGGGKMMSAAEYDAVVAGKIKEWEESKSKGRGERRGDRR